MTKQEHWTAVVFLSECLLHHIDELVNTDQYKQNLKRHLNGAIKEIEKIQSVTWKSFEVAQEKNKKLPLLEMNYAISNAYPELINIFKNTPSWQIPYIVQMIKQGQENDVFKEMMLEVKIIQK